MTSVTQRNSTEHTQEQRAAVPCFEPIAIEILDEDWFDGKEMEQNHDPLNLEGYAILTNENLILRIEFLMDNGEDTESSRQNNYEAEVMVRIQPGMNHIGWLPSIMAQYKITILPVDRNTTVKKYYLKENADGKHYYKRVEQSHPHILPWTNKHTTGLVTMENDEPLTLIQKSRVYAEKTEHEYYMSLDIPPERKTLWKIYVTLDTATWWGNRREKRGIQTEWGYYGLPHRQIDYGNPPITNLEKRHKTARDLSYIDIP